MDIVGGLTAAKLALDLAKDLRGIDRSVDEATFKLKLADLSTALADTQLALSEAKVKMADLERELQAAKLGDICPKCLAGRLRLVRTEGHFYGGLANFGVEDWDYQCDSLDCNFEQRKLHDPHGAISKAAARR